MPIETERKPIVKSSPIVLISKAPSPDGKLDSPRGPGVLESAKLLTLGIPPVHAALVEAGFTNVQSIDTQYNSRGLLTRGNWRDIKNADVVMTTNITRTAPPTLELVQKTRLINPKSTIFMGGFHASTNDEEGIRAGADVIVRGEGFVTPAIAMESLISNGNVDGVKGTTHKKGNDIVREEPRPLLTVEELAKLPRSIYASNVLKSRDYDTYFTSLGCPFDCNFCCVTGFYKGTYRRLPNEIILGGLRDTLQRTPQKGVFLIDDNLFVNKKETKSLFREMINQGIILPPGSMAQVRESAGEDPEFLDLAYKAGVRILFVGIESINDQALIEMGKKTTSANIKQNITNMRRAGFWIHGMFIFGFDADTRERGKELLDWAKSNVHSAQFFPPIPLPGTDDTIKKEQEGRILSKKYHLYDGTYVLSQPKNFTPWELQQFVDDMSREFYRPDGLIYYKDDALPRIDARDSSNNTLNKQAIKTMLIRDAKIRTYANWVAFRMSMDSTRKEYYKALQNWKPGQQI